MGYRVKVFIKHLTKVDETGLSLCDSHTTGSKKSSKISPEDGP
jgi:hypothetical protein